MKRHEVFRCRHDAEDYFGKPDAKSAEVLRQLKSVTLDKVDFHGWTSGRTIVEWIFAEAAKGDGLGPFSVSIHDSVEKDSADAESIGAGKRARIGETKSPLYSRCVSAYDALWYSLTSGKMCLIGPLAFMNDGCVDVWLVDPEYIGWNVCCEYEIVPDATSERVFGKFGEGGLQDRIEQHREWDAPSNTEYCWFKLDGSRIHGVISGTKKADGRCIVKVVGGVAAFDEFEKKLYGSGVRYTVLPRKAVPGTSAEKSAEPDGTDKD